MIDERLDVSVVVPVRNAENLVDECLASIVRARPLEIIVVDGLSTDQTLERVGRYPVTVLSDGGGGLPAARLIGARAARSRWVALVDADIVLPDGALAALLAEASAGGYTALQAGLHLVIDLVPPTVHTPLLLCVRIIERDAHRNRGIRTQQPLK